jgi:PAS domain S-box-containing protein
VSDYFHLLSASGNFMLHGQCCLWQPARLWRNVGSDALIAGAYFSIPLAIHATLRALIWIVRRAKLRTTPLELQEQVRALVQELSEINAQLTAEIAARTAAVSGMRVAQQERERADLLLRTIVDSAPCSIYAKDREGRMLLANPTALAVIGKSWADVKGRTDLEFLEDRSQAEAVTRNDQRLMDDNRVAQFEEAVGRAGGGERLWLSIKAPLCDRYDAITGLVGISFDITEKKRIEAESRRNSEWISIASQAAGHGFWDFNVESNTLQWDDQMFRLYGHTRSDGDQPYTLWTDSLHPDDRERSERAVRAALDGSCPFDTDFRIVHPDGRIRHIKSLARVICNADGRAVRMFGLNLDITERKEMEAAALQSLQRLNEAQRVGQMGDWDYDLRTQKITWSAQVFEIFGRDPLLGPPRNFEDHAVLHDPSSRATLEENVARAIESGEKQVYDLVALQPNGRAVPIHATAVPRTDDRGNVVALYGTVQDISARERAERLVRESEQRYRFLLETLPQIIWTSGPDGNRDYYNRRWYDYTGLTFEQSRGRGWQQALHPDDFQACVDRLGQAYGEGASYELEYRFKCSDGTYRWHLARGFPLRAADGSIVRWIGTCTDVHHQKQATADLLQAHATLEIRVRERTSELDAAKEFAENASKAKSEFLANMSHEIRTPLTAVIGLGYVLEQTNLTDDQRSIVDKIQFAGQSLLSVVNNVMDLSKIESREMVLEDENFDLLQLTRDIAQMLNPQAAAKGIELATKMSPALPRMVKGDMVRLRQILINLLSNAIKFTEVGRVGLELGYVELGADRVRLRGVVKDTGIGMESAALERLFTPFTQADASTTRRFGGTGLGLSICRRLVDLMGGEIGVTSCPGKGSEFWFEIPLRFTPRRAVASHAGDAGAVRPFRERSTKRERLVPKTSHETHMPRLVGVRVLVVDDSDINLEVARRILEKQGAIVASCSDGAAAVAHLRLHHPGPDIVLMDVQMPVMDGNEAARRIRGDLQLRALPIVALTAGALLSERQRSIDAGMNDFVAKPLDPHVLIGKIRLLVAATRGQSTPVIHADEQPGGPPVAAPMMASIDAAVVREVFGDDHALFESLVSRLLREYADLAVPIPDWSAASVSHRQELRQRLHKLRGSAGMIGASAVAELAGAAEADLQKDRPSGRTMKQLGRALMILRDEMQPLAERSAGAPD